MSIGPEFARLSASNSELRKQIAYYEQKINGTIPLTSKRRPGASHFVYPGEGRGDDVPGR